MIVVVAVSSDSERLVESSACIWAVRAEFLPFSMLFVGFFNPSLKSPSDLWIVVVCADDSIEESSFESEFELFYDSMFGKGEVTEACELFKLGDVFVKAFSLLEISQFSLCIFCCIGVGKGIAELCFEELPVLFISVGSSSCDTIDKLL